MYNSPAADMLGDVIVLAIIPMASPLLLTAMGALTKSRAAVRARRQ